VVVWLLQPGVKKVDLVIQALPCVWSSRRRPRHQ